MLNKKLLVTKRAKEKAKAALQLRTTLPSSKQFGITKQEAKKQGINSGVERAKQLITNKSIPLKDAEAVCRFKRWLPRKRTVKVQGAIDLWGGDKFIQKACIHVKKFK